MKAKILCFIAALLLLLPLTVLPASAEKPEIAPGCKFALYNIENDLFMMSTDPDEKIKPSSSTKLMSGLLICEKLGGRTEEVVTVTSDMISGVSGKSFQLAAGMKLDIKSLMIAAFSGGYNDAVTALACIAYGNTASFVAKMNERAKELGMYSTCYKNVTGLDTAGAVTTLRDVAVLVTKLSGNDLFLETSSEFAYQITFSDGTKKTSYGSNVLISKNSPYYCRSAKGMNSGATDSGACVITFAEHSGSRFAVIAMGYPEDESRFADIQNALDWAYGAYEYQTVFGAGTQVGTAVIKNSAADGQEFKTVLAEDLKIFSEKTSMMCCPDLTVIIYDETLKAPVAPGDVIGKCLIYENKKVVASADVTVGEYVDGSGVLDFLDGVKGYFTGRAFIAALISAAVYAVLVVAVPWILLSRRQKKRTHVRSYGGYKYIKK